MFAMFFTNIIFCLFVQRKQGSFTDFGILKLFTDIFIFTVWLLSLSSIIYHY